MKKLLNALVAQLQRIFKIIFGKEDPDLMHARALGEAPWQIISSPQILSDGTLTLFHYENKLVKGAVLAIKRRNDATIADIFARIAGDFLLEELSEMKLIKNFDNALIIGIPISRKGMREKGFNHTEEIAKRIAKQIPDLEFVSKALFKTRHTEPQKHLPRAKRLTNLHHSMEVSKNNLEKINSRCIIVVDDVSTTGATLTEAKRALISAGAKKVFCLALAH